MAHLPFLWASGTGSMPGTQMIEAASIVAGELELPYIPILADRGIDSTLAARTLGMLDSPFGPGPRGWQITGTTLMSRRLKDRLNRDLDDCEQAWANMVDRRSVSLAVGEPPSESDIATANSSNTGKSAIKLHVLGPWSLAARVELSDGHRILADRSAVRGMREEWAGALEEMCTSIARRFHADTYLHICEPDLGLIQAGMIEDTHQWDFIPAIHGSIIGRVLDDSLSQLTDHSAAIILDGRSSREPKGDARPPALSSSEFFLTSSECNFPWHTPVVSLPALESALLCSRWSSARSFVDRTADMIERRLTRITPSVRGDSGRGQAEDNTVELSGTLDTWNDLSGDPRIVLATSGRMGSNHWKKWLGESEQEQFEATHDFYKLENQRNLYEEDIAAQDSSPARRTAIRIARVWDKLGFDPQRLGDSLCLIDGGPADSTESRDFSDKTSLSQIRKALEIVRVDAGDLAS